MKFRTLVERYATFAGARFVLLLSRWTVLLYAAKKLPPDDFSALTALLSTVEILRAISDAGADNVIYARLGGRGGRIPGLLKVAALVRFSLSGLLFLLALPICWLIGHESGLLVIASLIPASALQFTSVALLQKNGRFGTLSGIVFAILGISGLVVLAVLQLQPSLGQTAVLVVVADLAAALLAGFCVRRQLWDLFRVRRGGLMRGLRQVVPKLFQTGVVSVAVVSYNRLDVLVVLPLCGVLAQSAYSAGFRFVEPIYNVFAIASLALLAELGSQGRNQSEQLVQGLLSSSAPLVLSLMLAFAVAAAATVYWAMEQLLGLSPAAAAVAAVLAANMPLRLASTFIAVVLQRLGYFRALMNVTLINAICIFLFAILLSSRFGAVGAAIGAVVGECVNVALLLRLLPSVRTSAGLADGRP
ncbi:hypothetical protein ED208_12135 [Stagnimonas aquatica]|uniref:Polysaccharide biosynthesis protein C-terminal domain-containing protein n=1 Tax=Stagnimonas aquatica TaxID=2689987 RepID=A0A3N0V8L7_9GAMM|nr:hypothetical protein [Stagnimonas aquatica]ROH89150.1 hypothetical protein ED208_12135 [Stagnimonas aquatica]